MNTRKKIIYVHLILTAFFLPFLLLMPTTGALYIWGFQGDQTKQEVFRITEPVPEDAKAQEDFFRRHLEQQGFKADFEYIRSNKTDFTLRPTSRDHFVASRDGEELVVYQMKPTLLRRLIELHKGHGPTFMRTFQSIFGVFLVMITFTGLWLAVTVPAYRKPTLLAFAGGALVIAFAMI